MAGLNIATKSHTKLKFAVIFVTILVIILVAAAGYYWYRWYYTGVKPPIAGSLVSNTIPTKSTHSDNASKLTETTGNTEPKYLNAPTISSQSVEVYKFDLTSSNTVDLSMFKGNAGWLDMTGFPGQGFGRTVLAINPVNAPTTGPSLAKFGDIQIGDPIAVTRVDNKVYNYKVTDVQVVGVKDFYKSGLGKLINPEATDDAESLGVVLAAGNWVPKDGQYSKYVLVTASLDIDDH